MKEKRFYDMVISQVNIGNLKSQKGTYPIYLINVQTVEISLCRNHEDVINQEHILNNVNYFFNSLH